MKRILSLPFFLAFMSLSVLGTKTPTPAAIYMPKFDSMENIIYFLHGIQLKYPHAFEGDNDFGIDLVKILVEQKLLNLKLLKIPGYKEAFIDRPYFSLSLEALKTITTTSERISPTAFQAWKGKLFQGLGRLQKSADKSTETLLKEEIERYRDFQILKVALDEKNMHLKEIVGQIWGGDFPSKLADTLKNRKFRNKNIARQKEELNQKIGDILKQNTLPNEHRDWLLALQQYPQIEDIKSRVLGLQFDASTEHFFRQGLQQSRVSTVELEKIADKINEVLRTENLSEHRKAFFLDRVLKTEEAKKICTELNVLNRRIDEEKTRLDGFSLENLETWAQLYAVLDKLDPHFAVAAHEDSARNILNTLTDVDLAFFADMDALSALSWFEELKPVAYKRFSHYAHQLRTYTTNLDAGYRLFLDEVPPIIGIFRGLIGGDCSTKYSFPFPNDPDERVFVIRTEKDAAPVGVLSATMVNIQINQETKKGLYLITIAGKALKPKDVELVFRGLHSIKDTLGVDEIVIPEKKNLAELLNYHAIRGVYQQYSKAGHKLANISYFDREGIRTVIETFESKNNTGKYDKMAENTRGTVLGFSAYPDGLPAVTASIIQSQPEKIESEAMDDPELIMFAIKQHLQEHNDVTEAVVNFFKKQPEKLETLKALFAAAENYSKRFTKSYRYLEKIQAGQPMDVLSQQKTVQGLLHNLAIPTLDPKMLSSLLYLGRLKAPDAFSKEHILETTTLITQDFCQDPDAPRCGEATLLRYRDELASTENMEIILQKLWRAVEKNDEASLTAVFLFFNLFPKNKLPNAKERAKIDETVTVTSELPILLTFGTRILAHDEAKNWPETKQVEEKIAECLKNSSPFDILAFLGFIKSLDQTHPLIISVHESITTKLSDASVEGYFRNNNDTFKTALKFMECASIYERYTPLLTDIIIQQIPQCNDKNLILKTFISSFGQKNLDDPQLKELLTHLTSFDSFSIDVRSRRKLFSEILPQYPEEPLLLDLARKISNN